MDKVTEALIDNRIKSLKGSVSNGKDNSSLLQEMMEWTQKTENEKSKRYAKHQKKEREREKMRNEYRKKYGIDKEKVNHIVQERKSYILESNTAVEVHPNKATSSPIINRSRTLEIENRASSSAEPNLKPRPHSTIGMYSTTSTQTESDRSLIGSYDKNHNLSAFDDPPSSPSQLYSQTTLHPKHSPNVQNVSNRSNLTTSSACKGIPGSETKVSGSVSLSVPLTLFKQPERKQNSSWENSSLVRKVLESPIFKRRAMTNPTEKSDGSKSNKEGAIPIGKAEKGIRKAASTQELSVRKPMANSVDAGKTEGTCFSLDSHDRRPANAENHRLKEIKRTPSICSSLDSRHSMSTALSDPREFLRRGKHNLNENDILNHAYSTECLSCTTPRSTISSKDRKAGIKKFMRKLRMKNDSIKCVEIASRGPGHCDHSFEQSDGLQERADSETDSISKYSNFTDTTENTHIMVKEQKVRAFNNNVEGFQSASRRGSQDCSSSLQFESTQRMSTPRQSKKSFSSESAMRAEDLYYSYQTRKERKS